MMPTRPLLTLWLGWSLAPLVQFIRHYVYDDFAFLLTLALVIGVDTVLGVWRGLVQRRLSSAAFGRLFQKVAFYALFLIAVHAIARHTVNGQPNALLSWLDSVAYSLILVRELLSLLENSAALGLFAPPAWLVSRLEQFAATGRMEAPPTSPSPPPTPDAPTDAPR